jgi:hypothetical protein
MFLYILDTLGFHSFRVMANSTDAVPLEKIHKLWQQMNKIVVDY